MDYNNNDNKMTEKFIFRINKEEKQMVIDYCRKLRLKPGTFIRNLLVTTVEKELEKENNK